MSIDMTRVAIGRATHTTYKYEIVGINTNCRARLIRRDRVAYVSLESRAYNHVVLLIPRYEFRSSILGFIVNTYFISQITPSSEIRAALKIKRETWRDEGDKIGPLSAPRYANRKSRCVEW